MKVVRALAKLRCGNALQLLEAFLVFTTMVGGWHLWGNRNLAKTKKPSKGIINAEALQKSFCDMLLLDTENSALKVCNDKDKAVCGEVLQPKEFDKIDVEPVASKPETKLREAPSSTLLWGMLEVVREEPVEADAAGGAPQSSFLPPNTRRG